MPYPSKALSEHRLAGTYSKDRHAKRADNVLCTDPLPEPPHWLEGMALEEYRRIQQAFLNTGILTSLDAGLVIAYSVLYAQIAERTRDGKNVGSSHFAALATLTSRLGLDPQSRARLRVPDAAPAAADDPWAEMAKAVPGKPRN